ncbi:metallophosphoesterase [Alysiella filiformis]|nr:metallophosphoesterase [Alysiella filiformis]QMT31674.1 metallophosphoesterase [Alysiella filiformis]UBQ55316.1 metallophosphoesterase [Alysiella filiformis DSM 16848]
MSQFPIIFFTVWAAVQFLSFNLARGLAWQGKMRHVWARRGLLLMVLAISNGLMLLAFLRLHHHIFRINAIWLTVLWFVFLATVLAWIVANILRRSRVARYQNADLLQADLRKIAPVLVVAMFGLGWFNAYVPAVRRVVIEIDKPMAQPVRIAMVADTHLGVLVGKRQLDKLANILNEEKVDLVLMPGDIMDDDIAAYTAENMKPHLQKIRAPLGVFATLGNHDVREGKHITQAIESAGIRVLRDEAVWVDNRFWVVGRPDNLDAERLPTAQLLQKANVQQPIFLLDHRPDGVLAHAKLPIDLQVSGHVHNGQIFPGNWVVRFLNEIHYGYAKRGNTHFVVTSGYGFWGIPFRLGSQAEVWIIDVQGKKTVG